MRPLSYHGAWDKTSALIEPHCRSWLLTFVLKAYFVVGSGMPSPAVIPRLYDGPIMRRDSANRAAVGDLMSLANLCCSGEGRE